MRVTTQMLALQSLDRLQSRLQAYERSQSAMSTGRAIQSPSDDPNGMRRAFGLRNELRARQQELRNADDARSRLDLADTQLQGALRRLQRVRELAAAGANAATPDEQAARAREVRSIRDEIVEIANAHYLDRPLFGGFAAGDSITFDDATQTWQSHGDGDEIKRRVGDRELVRVNVTAADWLGFGGPTADSLTMLDELAGALEAGAPHEVSAKLDDIDQALGRITSQLSVVGATANRVDAARSRADEMVVTLRRELSQIEDVDLAQGIMELQAQQVALEATVQSLAKAFPPSLASFLR